MRTNAPVWRLGSVGSSARIWGCLSFFGLACHISAQPVAGVPEQVVANAKKLADSLGPADAATIDALAAKLQATAAGKVETYLAIFFWVSSNVAYDERTLNGKKRTPAIQPEAVFADRCAQCGGLSNLIVALARKAGIEAEPVFGYGKTGWDSMSFRPSYASHQWVKVVLDGVAYWSEPTLGVVSYQDNAGRHPYKLRSPEVMALGTPAEFQYLSCPYPQTSSAAEKKEVLRRFLMSGEADPSAVRHGLTPNLKWRQLQSGPYAGARAADVLVPEGWSLWAQSDGPSRAGSGETVVIQGAKGAPSQVIWRPSRPGICRVRLSLIKRMTVADFGKPGEAVLSTVVSHLTEVEPGMVGPRLQGLNLTAAALGLSLVDSPPYAQGSARARFVLTSADPLPAGASLVVRSSKITEEYTQTVQGVSVSLAVQRKGESSFAPSQQGWAAEIPWGDGFFELQLQTPEGGLDLGDWESQASIARRLVGRCIAAWPNF